MFILILFIHLFVQYISLLLVIIVAEVAIGIYAIIKKQNVSMN